MLRNKIAVITGANRGIGLATAKVFAENGANVWVCARKQSLDFENEIESINEKYMGNAYPIYFDVTDSDAVKRAFKEISAKNKRIDILVNNAGVSIEKLFNMTSMDMLKSVMETNFLSQINISQIVSRYMIRNKKGSIINIASVAGMEPEEGGLAYGSSKASVIFSSGTMALELGKYGIRVNSVSPGFIKTDMWENREEKIFNKILKETSLCRQGLPEEVAKTILFLASDMSSYITGQNIVVDGGRKLGG